MKILVPTAGVSSASDNAAYVVDIAKRLNAELIVLHVIRVGGSSESSELCFDIFRNAAEQSNVGIRFDLKQGSIINQIIEVAEKQNVDLILMGVSNGLVIDQWISADVHDQTTIPVLVIPYQIFTKQP